MQTFKKLKNNFVKLFIVAILMLISVQFTKTDVLADTPTLMQIANSFNTCNTIAEYEEANVIISAKVNGNKLTITYSNYKAEYTLEDNILSIHADKGDEAVTLKAWVSVILVDSVGKLHGYKDGEMFPTVNDEKVLKTYTLEKEGLEVITNDGAFTMKLDISKKVPIIPIETVYIEPKNLQTGKEYISGEGYFYYNKYGLELCKQTEPGKSYFIVGEPNALTSRTYNSILSVIQVMLTPEEAQYFKDNYSGFSEGNKSFGKYKVTVNPDLSIITSDMLRRNFIEKKCVLVEVNRPEIKGSGSKFKSTIKPTIKPTNIIKLAVPSFKLTAKKKSFKIKVSSVNRQSGFFVKYKKTGAKKWTTKKYFAAKTVTKTIKKLKAKKTYLVKVRSFNVTNKKVTYGNWSKVKKVKVKK